MDFPVDFVRSCFPAVAGSDRAFLDNAAETQVPQVVSESAGGPLSGHDAHPDDVVPTTGNIDELFRRTRDSLAAFANAGEPREIVFGTSATSLIRAFARAFGNGLQPGDEIVVSELDHEANIAPWLELEKRGARIKVWPIERESARLAIEELDALLSPRTRLVAVTKASCAVGSIVDLISVAERIHARKGYLFVDAVHFASHGPLDVRYFGCDSLVCSGHKMFGPDVGFLWGRRDVLDSLAGFGGPAVWDGASETKELAAPRCRALAGLNSAIGYIEELGRRSRHLPLPSAEDLGRRGDLRRGMQAIRQYERTLSEHVLQRSQRLRSVRVHGVGEPAQAALRTPTFCFEVEGMGSAETARMLGEAGVLVGNGDLKSPRLLRAMGFAEGQTAVRASFSHYNTMEEGERLLDTLSKLVG